MGTSRSSNPFNPAWPNLTGEMPARVRDFNWNATQLGPVHSWPVSLKSAVELMLSFGFPATLQWGEEGILLYKATNTGLGLWITRDLIEKHNGRLRFRSRQSDPHRGTIFTLFLPTDPTS